MLFVRHQYTSYFVINAVLTNNLWSSISYNSYTQLVSPQLSLTYLLHFGILAEGAYCQPMMIIGTKATSTGIPSLGFGEEETLFGTEQFNYDIAWLWKQLSCETTLGLAS